YERGLSGRDGPRRIRIVNLPVQNWLSVAVSQWNGLSGGVGTGGLCLGQQAGKISVQLIDSRKIRELCAGLGRSESFPVSEEVGVPLAAIIFWQNDGAACRDAVLVHSERRLTLVGQVREVIGGIQGVIAEELPGIAMKSVASGFRDDVDVGARGDAELRVDNVGLHIEFLNGVGRRADGPGV